LISSFTGYPLLLFGPSTMPANRFRSKNQQASRCGGAP
jgi:hypothetical protein